MVSHVAVLVIILCFGLALVVISGVEKVDEESPWVDLTEEQMGDWYGEMELCMLKATEKHLSSPHEVKSSCQHLGQRGHRGCIVGRGSNKFPCYPPFAARKSFSRGVKGYTDASLTPLSDAFRSIAKANQSLVMLGDSTMRQKLHAMDCELQRETSKSWITGNLWGILPCHSPLTYNFENYTVNVHGINIGPPAVNCMPGGLHKNDPEGGGLYEYARDIIRRLNQEGRSVYVVANVGLWYNEESHLASAIPGLFKWLTNVTEETMGGTVKNTVVWHETMSQHWPNKQGSGYYSRQSAIDVQASGLWSAESLANITIDKFSSPTCCTPITNTSRGNDWRNELVQDHLAVLKTEREAEGKESLFDVLPFKKYTKDTADMHVCHPLFKYDCTHYCYWPLLWQPLWHQLKERSAKLPQVMY